MTHVEPTENGFAILERSLANDSHNMYELPEIRGVLSHAAEQMKRVGGT
jgi:hypothetical protein